MKKIINGKMYNTETAKLIGDWYDYYPGDFRYVREELYVKKTGEYFIYGVGGAMSRYAERDGDGRCGGCAIVPYTVSEAKEWVEKYCSADTYIEIFGEPEE